MGRAEVSGNHAQRLTAPTEQGRRLHRAETDGGSDLPILLKGGIGLNVLNDDARPPPQSSAASGTIVAYFTELIEEVRLKTMLRPDLQCPVLGVIELDVAKVRVLQFDRGIENFLQEGLEF